MRSLWVVYVVGCSGTDRPVAMRPRDPDPAAISRAAGTVVQAVNHGDAASIEALLDEPFDLGGVWFEDPVCRQFATPARLLHDKFPAFAKCLSTLRLQPSGRGLASSSGALVTYGPGLELELGFFGAGSSTWLHSIGPAARRETEESIPTMSPVLLDSLRTTREAPDPSTVDRLEAEMTGRDHVFAWLKLCLDVAGHVAVETREATSQVVGDAFAGVAKTWKFDPLVLDGQPSRACSFVRLVYPAGKGPAAEDVPIPDRPPVLEPPKVLEARRAAGEKNVVPDDDDKTALSKAGGKRQIVGSFKVCLDATGKIELVNVLKGTGLLNYDRKIVRTITRTWRYTPFKVDGVPKPICSAVTFIYAQH